MHNTAEATQPVQNAAEPSQLVPNATEHPFRGAKDASYVPATTKSTGVQQTGNKKQEPAFRTLPPVPDAAIASDMYKHTMELPITITQCKLLLLCPEVHAQIRKAMTTKCIQNKEANVMVQEEYKAEMFMFMVLPFPTFAVQNISHCTLPKGATIIPDAYEAYI